MARNHSSSNKIFKQGNYFISPDFPNSKGKGRAGLFDRVQSQSPLNNNLHGYRPQCKSSTSQNIKKHNSLKLELNQAKSNLKENKNNGSNNEPASADKNLQKDLNFIHNQVELALQNVNNNLGFAGSTKETKGINLGEGINSKNSGPGSRLIDKFEQPTIKKADLNILINEKNKK